MQNSILKISRTMEKSRPVFIVGAPRSGTSILYRTIQQHSSFRPRNCADPAGVELTESNIFRDPYSTYNHRDTDAFAYLLKDSAVYKQFLQTVQPIQRWQSVFLGRAPLHKALGKINALSVGRTWLWSLSRSDDLIRTYLYFAQMARGVNRIVEKTPQHIAFLPEIRATFPRAKLLFMPRHPVEVFSSYRRRWVDAKAAAKSPQEIRWLDLSPQSFCAKYAAYSTLALRAAQADPETFLIVKYEDFTSDPQGTLTTLFSFLDEPFEATCIPQDETQKSTWKDDPNLFSTIQVSTKKWEKYISRDDVRWIEHRLAQVMEQVGYLPYLS